MIALSQKSISAFCSSEVNSSFGSQTVIFIFQHFCLCACVVGCSPGLICPLMCLCAHAGKLCVFMKVVEHVWITSVSNLRKRWTDWFCCTCTFFKKTGNTIEWLMCIHLDVSNDFYHLNEAYRTHPSWSNSYAQSLSPFH